MQKGWEGETLTGVALPPGGHSEFNAPPNLAGLLPEGALGETRFLQIYPQQLRT